MSSERIAWTWANSDIDSQPPWPFHPLHQQANDTHQPGNRTLSMSPFQSPLVDEYRRRTQKSARLAEQAARVLPSGVTHDGRYLQPYPIYVERAAGSRKWDVDGNEYVDYAGGHGALLLGHNHPRVVEAVAEATGRAARTTAPATSWKSAGASWCNDWFRRPRGCASPAPAPRPRCWRCGWPGRSPAEPRSCDSPATFTAGTTTWPSASARTSTARRRRACSSEVAPRRACWSPPGDVDATARSARRARRHRGRDHRADRRQLGAGAGVARSSRGAGRDDAARGVLLIFDEVITGFRCSPGGAQAAYRHHARPDDAGQDPGRRSCPAARWPAARDIMDALDFAKPRPRPAARRSRTRARSTPTRSRPPPASPRCEIVADDRRLPAGQRLRRPAARGAQSRAARRASAVGRLRHVLRLSHLHQSRAAARSRPPTSKSGKLDYRVFKTPPRAIAGRRSCAWACCCTASRSSPGPADRRRPSTPTTIWRNGRRLPPHVAHAARRR